LDFQNILFFGPPLFKIPACVTMQVNLFKVNLDYSLILFNVDLIRFSAKLESLALSSRFAFFVVVFFSKFRVGI